jgi:DNA-binding transcriptional ArsR family regulator
MNVAAHTHFVYDQIMAASSTHVDETVPAIAAAIGEPARARMLYSMMDGRARTATELAVIAGVSPSTASIHLARLKDQRLLKAIPQGKHRYFALDGSDVANVLEALNVLAGTPHNTFTANTPRHLCQARTCYDHIAGTLGVALHDRLRALRWLATTPQPEAFDLTTRGEKELQALGVDVTHTRSLRRHFAPACLDWSERRPHIGGSLGAALLTLALRKKWVNRELDSRALEITARGRREMQTHLGLQI